MLVLSSPSGAGKTTLARRLLEEDKEITMSVSTTTRAPRPGEVEGTDYNFTDTENFTDRRNRDEFLEWALVFDNFYGTPIAPIEEAIAQGHDILFDIDWQGAEQICKARRSDVVTIFILPPSGKALEERLRKRAQDSDEVVKRRMAGASNEIRRWDSYDYVIINEDIGESLSSIRAILASQRLKRERRTGLSDFVKQIQNDL